MDYEALMDQARLTNAARDESERRFGWASPRPIILIS
jgi:hypothetical protein